MGRLYEIEDGSGNVERLLYDGYDLVMEYNASGNITARYVHGVSGGDDPLIAYPGASAARSNAQHLYADRLGSIVAAFDRAGGVEAINAYDEFGVPGASSGIANTGRFRYTGQMWIPELGQYHYKARAYSPGLGRFMQTDPIGYADGLNMYAYVGNDPVSLLDITGLLADCLGLYCDEKPGDPAFFRSGTLSHGDPYHFAYLISGFGSAAAAGIFFGSPLPYGTPCLVEAGYAFFTNEEANTAGARAAEAKRDENNDRRNEYGWRVVPAGSRTWTFTPIEKGGRGEFNTEGRGSDGGWGHLHNRGDGNSLSEHDQVTTKLYVRDGALGQDFSTALVGDDGNVYTWRGATRLNRKGRNHGKASCK